MKKALKDKLESSDLERNFKYFWRKEIKDQINITYAHFMNMLNKDAAMRADVSRAINNYLEGK